MSNTDEMLREILSDSDLMQKYDLRQTDIEKVRCAPPYSKNIIEVMSLMIIEMTNGRTPRQIYPIIKNIHKI